MRIFFIGDIVGTPGMRFVRTALPILRQRENIDLTIANAENASGGSGLFPSNYKQLRNCGVDGITMGDHIYKKIDIQHVLTDDEPIVKPANYPDAAPGRRYVIITTADRVKVAFFSLLGRTFMKPVDCPFLAADRVLKELPQDIKCILVDVHAEATGEKYLLGHYLKGRVSAVVGTHTHVPTADEQILPGGTAFVCDVGMTGSYSGVLGRKVEPVLSATVNFVPEPFDIAEGDVRIGGALIDIDADTGRATAIRRFMPRQDEFNSQIAQNRNAEETE